MQEVAFSGLLPVAALEALLLQSTLRSRERFVVFRDSPRPVCSGGGLFEIDGGPFGSQSASSRLEGEGDCVNIPSTAFFQDYEF